MGYKKNTPSVWQRVKDPNYPFVAFYAGAGTGGVEIPLTRRLIDERGSDQEFEVYCEDPSEAMQKGFHIIAAEAGIQPLVKKYVLAEFEDLAFTPPNADLSVGSHMFYYVRDWQEVPRDKNSLAKFAATVQERKGVGIMTLQSETSDNFIVRSIWSPVIHGTEERYGEELSEELDRLGIKHHDDIVVAYTNIESVFPNGEFDPTPEGILLLSFILRAPWQEQRPTTQRAVARDLTRIVDANGSPVMKFRDRYIWISGER